MWKLSWLILALGGINRTPLLDIFLEGWDNAGPFPDVKSFHDWYTNLANQLHNLPRNTDPERQCLPDDSPIFFTHADLNPENIIVSSPGDGPTRVLAIIDWHQSGWYPAYWEYCKAFLQYPIYPYWKECLDTILAPHNRFIYEWNHYARLAGYWYFRESVKETFEASHTFYSVLQRMQFPKSQFLKQNEYEEPVSRKRLT